MSETIKNFKKRKQEHIKLSLEERTQARSISDFDRLESIPEALPDINFSDVSLQTKLWGLELARPFFISSMTAGSDESIKINASLATLAQEAQILMGVGSQ